MITQNNAKILWAIDTTSDKANQLKTGALLKALTKGQTVSIEPVSVLSPDQLRVPSAAFKATSQEYRLEAEKVLKNWLKAVKLPGILPPTLLLSENFSRRASVQTLLKYAGETRCGLIAMNTQARKGLMRFLLGSLRRLYCWNPGFRCSW